MSVVQSLSFQQDVLRDKDLKIVNLQSKLKETSAVRKASDEELAKLRAGMDQELTMLQGKLWEKTAKLLKLSLELS